MTSETRGSVAAGNRYVYAAVAVHYSAVGIVAMAVMAVAPPVIGVATPVVKLTLATAGLLEYQLAAATVTCEGSGLVCQIYCRARPGCSDGGEIDIGACAVVREALRPEQWPARPSGSVRGAEPVTVKVAVCRH